MSSVSLAHSTLSPIFGKKTVTSGAIRGTDVSLQTRPMLLDGREAEARAVGWDRSRPSGEANPGVEPWPPLSGERPRTVGSRRFMLQKLLPHPGALSSCMRTLPEKL